MIFVIDPPIAEAIFLQHWPEAREVTEIMASGSFTPEIVFTPQVNNTAFAVEVVTITTPGTPQQFPSLVVPDGRSLLIAAAVQNGGAREIFVANSALNVGDPTKRVELKPGNSITLHVDNADKVWVDVDGGSNQKVVAIVEQ